TNRPFMAARAVPVPQQQAERNVLLCSAGEGVLQLLQIFKYGISAWQGKSVCLHSLAESGYGLQSLICRMPRQCLSVQVVVESKSRQWLHSFCNGDSVQLRTKL